MVSKESITFLIDNLGSGGAQKQLYVLCSFLVKRNYEIRVVCYHVYGDDFYTGPLRKVGVTVDHFVLASYFKRTRTIAQHLKEHPSQFVFSYLYGANILACLVKLFWIPKMKLVVSDRMGVLGQPSLKDWIRYLLYSIANKVFTNSFDISEKLSLRAPWLKSKITTFWNIVDLPELPATPSVEALKTRILTGASFHYYKNHLRFIQAIDYAIKNLGVQTNQFEVICFGNFMLPENAEYINQIKEYILTNGLSDSVMLNEAKPNLESEIRACDFVALPSLFEGCPNFVIEGMAWSKPVLVSNVCANGYIVGHKGGYLFDPTSIEDMAMKFKSAIESNIIARIAMGEANRTRCSELFSAQRNLEIFEETLDELR